MNWNGSCSKCQVCSEVSRIFFKQKAKSGVIKTGLIVSQEHLSEGSVICLWVLPLTHTSSFGFPKDGHTFPLTGSAIGDKGLAVTVFMDWTLTHVRHTRPTEGRIWFCLRLSSCNEKRFYWKPHTSMVMVGQRNGYVWQATVFGTLTIKLSLEISPHL